MTLGQKRKIKKRQKAHRPGAAHHILRTLCKKRAHKRGSPSCHSLFSDTLSVSASYRVAKACRFPRYISMSLRAPLAQKLGAGCQRVAAVRRRLLHGQNCRHASIVLPIAMVCGVFLGRHPLRPVSIADRSAPSCIADLPLALAIACLRLSLVRDVTVSIPFTRHSRLRYARVWQALAARVGQRLFQAQDGQYALKGWDIYCARGPRRQTAGKCFGSISMASRNQTDRSENWRRMKDIRWICRTRVVTPRDTV